MLTYYIYCRVSSKKQDNRNNGNISLDMQLKNCFDYLSELNLDHINIKKVSEVCSAKDINNQKKLLKIFEEIENKGIIIVNSFDRFCRNYTGFFDYIYKIVREKQLSLYSVVQRKLIYFNNLEDISFLHNYLIYAQKEIDIFSKRVLDRINYIRNKGGWVGIRAPFGKKKVVNSFGIPKLEIDKYEMNIVKRIKKMVEKFNMTPSQIYQIFLADNIKNRDGKNFKLNSIIRIIKNPQFNIKIKKISNKNYNLKSITTYLNKHNIKDNHDMSYFSSSDESDSDEDKLNDNTGIFHKILDKKVDNGITKYLISWLGYSEEYNEWLNESDIFDKEAIHLFETSYVPKINESTPLNLSEIIIDNMDIVNNNIIKKKNIIRV